MFLSSSHEYSQWRIIANVIRVQQFFQNFLLLSVDKVEVTEKWIFYAVFAYKVIFYFLMTASEKIEIHIIAFLWAANERERSSLICQSHHTHLVMPTKCIIQAHSLTHTHTHTHTHIHTHIDKYNMPKRNIVAHSNINSSEIICRSFFARQFIQHNY